MEIEAFLQSRIMVTTSCNLLLAQRGRFQVEEDCLRLTDLRKGRGNEAEMFYLKRLRNVPSSQWDILFFQ